MGEQPPGRNGCEADRGRNWFDRAVGHVCRGAAGVAAGAILTTLAVTGYGVFMRYVLGTPITWIDEASGYLVVASVMFGAAEALRRDDHIQVDLLTARLDGRHLRAMRILWMLLIALFIAVLLFSAWHAVRFSFDFGLYSDGSLETPMWMPQALLVVGPVLVLLAAFAKIGRVLGAGPRTGRDGY